VDFSQHLDVKQRHLPLVRHDVLSLDISKDLIGREFSSILELDVDGSKLSISRNYEGDNRTFDPASSSDPEEWLSKKMGDGANIGMVQQFMVEYSEDEGRVRGLISSILNTNKKDLVQQSTPEAVREKLKATGEEDILKYVDILGEIETIGGQINAQKNADTAQLKIKELEGKVETIEDKLTSVTGLLQQQQRIQNTLQRYGGLLSKNLEQDAQQFATEMQQIRERRLLRMLKNVGVASVRQAGKLVRIIRAPKFVLVLAAIVFILGLIGFLFTSKLDLLIVGMVSAGATVLLWFKAEISTRSIQIIGDSKGESVKLDEGDVVVQQEHQRASFLERFFVDKAWINALRGEQHRVDDQITQSLDGQDYTVYQGQKNELVQELAKLRKQVGEQQQVELSPEEYLKRRRELDMRKVDKARIESRLKKREDYSELEKDILALTAAEPQTVEDGGLEISVLPTYSHIRVGTGDVIEMKSLATGQWQQPELGFNELYGILFYFRLKQWERNPVVPFVIINALHHLQNGILDYVNARINQLGDLGQVIVVNLAL